MLLFLSIIQSLNSFNPQEYGSNAGISLHPSPSLVLCNAILIKCLRWRTISPVFRSENSCLSQCSPLFKTNMKGPICQLKTPLWITAVFFVAWNSFFPQLRAFNPVMPHSLFRQRHWQGTLCVRVCVHSRVKAFVFLCKSVSECSVPLVSLCLCSYILLPRENSVPGLLSCSVYRRVSVSEEANFSVVHPHQPQSFPVLQ